MSTFNHNNIPEGNYFPSVFIDISVGEDKIGRMFVELYPDVFPEAVENFISICKGNTERVEYLGGGKTRYRKVIRRFYKGCKFYHKIANNYLMTGDIYKNDGSSGGTIYNDCPIPARYPVEYYSHDRAGLISLVPFVDESGRYYFDSNFMITLDAASANNLLENADCENIVIGRIYDGLQYLTEINKTILPFNGKQYPDYYISDCGYHNINYTKRKHMPILL